MRFIFISCAALIIISCDGGAADTSDAFPLNSSEDVGTEVVASEESMDTDDIEEPELTDVQTPKTFGNAIFGQTEFQ
jgi:hypothetical protein